jgi:hypothetical protein
VHACVHVARDKDRNEYRWRIDKFAGERWREGVERDKRGPLPPFESRHSLLFLPSPPRSALRLSRAGQGPGRRRLIRGIRMRGPRGGVAEGSRRGRGYTHAPLADEEVENSQEEAHRDGKAAEEERSGQLPRSTSSSSSLLATGGTAACRIKGELPEQPEGTTAGGGRGRAKPTAAREQPRYLARP